MQHIVSSKREGAAEANDVIEPDLMRMWAQSGLEKLAQDTSMVQDHVTEYSVESAAATSSSPGIKRKAPPGISTQQLQENLSSHSNPSPVAKKTKAQQGGTEKGSKGLRHFSLKVCQKVEEKGVTTYNEVADDLVKEFGQAKAAAVAAGSLPKSSYDEKNIRRRVYDALNVLMAMDIISKEKKEIRWRGLPSNATHDMEALKREKNMCLNSIRKQRQQLQELLLGHIAFKNLVKRNVAAAQRAELNDQKTERKAIRLPFIVVSTDTSTEVECQMAEDDSELFLNFSAPFQIQGSSHVLRRMQMHKAPAEELATLIPSHMIPYLPPEVTDVP